MISIRAASWRRRPSHRVDDNLFLERWTDGPHLVCRAARPGRHHRRRLRRWWWRWRRGGRCGSRRRPVQPRGAHRPPTRHVHVLAGQRQLPVCIRGVVRRPAHERLPTGRHHLVAASGLAALLAWPRTEILIYTDRDAGHGQVIVIDVVVQVEVDLVDVVAVVLLVVAALTLTRACTSPLRLMFTLTLSLAIAMQTDPVVLLLGMAGGAALVVEAARGASALATIVDLGRDAFLVGTKITPATTSTQNLLIVAATRGPTLLVDGVKVARRCRRADLNAHASVGGAETVSKVVTLVGSREADLLVILASTVLVRQNLIGLLDALELVLFDGSE